MDLLTVPEVARVLRVSPPRVYELARDGLIPVVRLGRQVRVEQDALRRWIASGGQALPGGWRRQSEDHVPRG
jgi:excisionase family DNA binding protein